MGYFRSFILIGLLALTVPLPVSVNAQVVPKDEEDEAAVVPCPVVTGSVRFCGTSPEFVLTPQTDNAAITSYYATPEGIQAIIIAEPLGLQDGLTIPALQSAALEILSMSSGQVPSEIPILERSNVTISGTSWPNFVYSGTIDGFPIVYSNSIVLFADNLAQFVTLEVGVTTLSPRHRDLHARFLANMQVAQ